MIKSAVLWKNFDKKETRIKDIIEMKNELNNITTEWINKVFDNIINWTINILLETFDVTNTLLEKMDIQNIIFNNWFPKEFNSSETIQLIKKYIEIVWIDEINIYIFLSNKIIKKTIWLNKWMII